MTELTDETVKALLADYSMPDPPSKAHAIFRAGPALARALLDARAELVRLRAESDAFRMCVNCGLIVPASHDRAQPGPGCAAPDACTFDLTPREACDHWRAKAHKYQADAQAAVALVVERAADMIEDNVRHAKELGREIWAMPDLRALAPADGLAAVDALRKERDEAKRLMEMRHREMLAADALMRKHQRRAEKAEADRDRLAAANAALEAKLARLAGALASAASHLWFAATKMKGRCSGSDVSAIKMAEANARAALAALEAKNG